MLLLVVGLLLGGSAHVYAVTFGLAALCMQVFLPYQAAVSALKWLTLALLAYVAVVFSLHLDWLEVAKRTLEAQLQFNTDMPIMAVMMLLATRPAVMGPHVIGKRLKLQGRLATAAMALTLVALARTSLF